MMRVTLLLLPCLTVPALAQVKAPPGQRVPMGWPIEDCNANGVPDLTDIWLGTSADCNQDRIPDECQLAVEGIYLHDDWIMDGWAGWGFPHEAWLAQYAVRPGEEVITEVEVAWGIVPPGTAVTVGLWSDPDGDGDPTDAQLLTSVATTTSLEHTGKRVRVDLPDRLIGPAGTTFFVGVYGEFDPPDYPMGYDYGTPSYSSWILLSNNPIDPHDLTAGTQSVAVLADADWVLRGLSCASGHCGELSDENFDDIPDQCQPQDCNLNGIPDDQDIALGTSEDCQGDGVPDECQTDPGDVIYALDDGEMDTAVGTGHDYYAWLNRFVVQPGGEVVTDVRAVWGAMLPGTQLTVCLWSDPDGDGDPTDAQLLLGWPVLSTYEFTGKWVDINIPDTPIGPAGTSFFLGAYGYFEFAPNKPVWYAAGLDSTQPDLQAWFVSADTPIDLNNLSAGATEFGRLNTVCSCDGDWTLRAITCPGTHCNESTDINQNGEPDECEPDCDGDGLPDSYEIQVGLATDCDGNGVPDNCESLADCDANGLPDVCQVVTPGGLAGSYYPSRNLSGEPLARIDPQVMFDFGATPPFPGSIPANGFSVRWTGSVKTTLAGVYTFGVLHDDGARLWVDGKLVIDEWYAAAGAVFETGYVDLPAATEVPVRLEYFQDVGGAQVQLQWQPPGGMLLPMQPYELRPIQDRNGDGVPDPCQLASDCNGNGIEDADDIASGASRDCDGNGVPDECQRCEDSDGNGWLDGCELTSGPGLVGQYFRLDPTTLAFASRAETRLDAQVDFDWGSGAPAGGLPPDRFGARWTGTLTTPGVSGSYAFTLQADDGARLWLDEVLLIDTWGSGGTGSASIGLSAASAHLLRLEYQELGAGASLRLSWTVPGAGQAVVPASALTPDTDLDGDGLPDLAPGDCNLNGIPDPLDPDLNANCVPDDCEGGTGYWRFEEAGGTTAFDETGNGLDGTLSLVPYRVPDVPVAVIPQTGAPNQQSLNNGWVGSVSVPDVGGLLTVPDNGFTLEAWVQLDVLGVSNGNPNQRQWLFMKKPAAGSDALLEFGLLVQAGDLGSTGRELAFRYGDGTNVRGVVSSLAIRDYDWHFVSVAYDPAWRELRFGLDGVFETVPFTKPAIANLGRLLMGAHENQQAKENQWLFGTYDEPRFTRAFLPPEALLD